MLMLPFFLQETKHQPTTPPIEILSSRLVPTQTSNKLHDKKSDFLKALRQETSSNALDLNGRMDDYEETWENHVCDYA